MKRYRVKYKYYPSKQSESFQENLCFGERTFNARRSAERFLRDGDKRSPRLEPYGAVEVIGE